MTTTTTWHFWNALEPVNPSEDKNQNQEGMENEDKEPEEEELQDQTGKALAMPEAPSRHEQKKRMRSHIGRSGIGATTACEDVQKGNPIVM